MNTRRRAAIAIAFGASVYLAPTALTVVTPGVWLPAPAAMFTSPVSSPVLALIVAAVVLQVGVTAAWARRATFRRRYVGLVAAAEVVLGAGLFWMAPGLHGSGAPTAPRGEPIYLMPAWSLWGLLCLSVVGLLMVVATVVHGPSTRHSAGRAERVPAA